jgi:hypothetical protein
VADQLPAHGQRREDHGQRAEQSHGPCQISPFDPRGPGLANTIVRESSPRQGDSLGVFLRRGELGNHAGGAHKRGFALTGSAEVQHRR